MADQFNIRNFPLKVVFLAHFVLISLSTLGHWSPPAYLFYNFLLILLLCWCIHDSESENPIQLTFLVNVGSIILDIFVLAFCYPSSYSATERFSAAMAIVHLVVRPFTTIYILQVLRDRTGNPNLLENILPARHNDSYEDIDRTSRNAASTSGYDINAAQQI